VKKTRALLRLYRGGLGDATYLRVATGERREELVA
jgi:hypothetical protein